MLVLTRKEGEALVIGDNVKLTILAIKGGQVRVGIDAPIEVAIQRHELLDAANDANSVVDESNF